MRAQSLLAREFAVLERRLPRPRGAARTRRPPGRARPARFGGIPAAGWRPSRPRRWSTSAASPPPGAPSWTPPPPRSSAHPATRTARGLRPLRRHPPRGRRVRPLPRRRASGSAAPGPSGRRPPGRAAWTRRLRRGRVPHPPLRPVAGARAARRPDRRRAANDGPGLYLDAPLGVHPWSFDVWSEPDAFALDMNGGAPPDGFFKRGQDWGFPPLHPRRSRAQGYRYQIARLRTLMAHAGLLRIDHVMGLHRLFWIPRGTGTRRRHLRHLPRRRTLRPPLPGVAPAPRARRR